MQHSLHTKHAVQVAGVHFAMINQDLLNKAWDLGKQIHGWTANTPEIMHSMLESTVDAVVTNYPVRMQQFLDTWVHACRMHQS